MLNTLKTFMGLKRKIVYDTSPKIKAGGNVCIVKILILKKVKTAFEVVTSHIALVEKLSPNLDSIKKIPEIAKMLESNPEYILDVTVFNCDIKSKITLN